MKIFETKLIQEWDKYTQLNEPIASIDLMERASKALMGWIKEHYSKTEDFVIFAGPGNNGGDALALARLLYLEGYLHINVLLLNIADRLSYDCHENLKRLEKIKGITFQNLCIEDSFPELVGNEIVIDGIFGSGLTRPIEGYWAHLVGYINTNSKAIISIDFPSGLKGEDHLQVNGAVIRAKYTLTFQFPKLAFFFADNYEFTGEWFVLEIGLHPKFLQENTACCFFTQKESVEKLLKQRNTFDHKGTYGHAFLIAGSYQMMGAAVLASKACMRAGVGLLTVHVPETGREILQVSVPEAMVCIDESEMNYCEAENLIKFTALGIGPGVGKKRSMQNLVRRLLDIKDKTMVFDADALNILAENKEWIHSLAKNTILTPHPGEFDRLTQKHNSSYERYISQIEFSKKYEVIIALKGAYTCITDPLGNSFFNSSGNPGMATAGSGDVLTGIILSLLSQGYTPLNAAKIGVYVHGLAGDLAADRLGFEALIASDIIKMLGFAFKSIKNE